ncbi:MAG: hypothetical protein HUU22_18275, partial [Phycisphaerae bacterium]|nr:hypothetical protein [Phycisphaerae bacterium]
ATAPAWAALARPAAPRGALLVCIPLAAYAAFLGHHIEEVFPPEWGAAKVRELSEELRRVTKPGDVVFSSWQGFTFMADRNDLPGNENFNARTVTPRLSLEECRRLKVATDLDLFESLVMRAEPKAIVIGFFTGPTGNKPFYRSTLYTRVAADPRNPRVTKYVIRPEIDRNYELLRVMGDHQLWVKRQ